ncbi:Glycosyl hydrolases family 2, sugar binding domain [Prauserella aidingensis]|uniref:glycosyl hydrolase n=1 Tax=Prauserella aidingensis TaxID=387890 RepID=UPI0020A375D0|nr:glycosyl hydrolase [Prauserella aidingensis]MCP2253193.1 Glycosyl hydrolases family 2, sugar binding domain [Prauserella aidingensis]
MLNRRQFIYGGALTGIAVVGGAALPAQAAQAARSPASEGASNPLRWPAFDRETRPWTRWWWLGSAVTGDGLRDELDQLAGHGFGGVEIQPIYESQRDEDRILPYLSREWLAALDTALRSAAERGLGVDLTSGSGWTFGGPWMDVRQSAGRALVEHWELRGGQRLDEPVKTIHPPHPDLVDEERLSRPDLRPPMPPIPEPEPVALVAREVETGETVDLTARIDRNRKLDWTAPPGNWRLTGVFNGWVLKRVERAGPGGKGLMADYFDESAIRHHLDHFADAVGSRNGIRALFHDSFELGGIDWTPSALRDFARLRGYELTPHLPELFDTGDTSETRTRLLSDVRETYSDLFLERFARPFTEFSAERDWLTRNQAHGSPANLLDVYGAADIPETEYTGGENIPIPGLRHGAGAQDPVPLVWRMASSAAHLGGGELVGAETVTWRDEHHHVSLSQIKPAVDILFAAGINHVVFHGTTYSPQDAPWPGVNFYAATQLRPENPWWRYVSELTGYITRCQSILQHGRHGNDVLVYWPQHDVWATPDGGGMREQDGELTPDYHWDGDGWMYPHPSGADEVVGGLERRGWQFDWASDRQLAEFDGRRGGVSNGRSGYAAVVVPGAELMPVDTLAKLHEFATAGATVIFVGASPRDVPGLGGLDERRTRLRELIAALAPGTGAHGTRRVGAGRVVVTDRSGVDDALADAGAVREPLADAGLHVVRRFHDDGADYFVANLTAEPVRGWHTLGTTAASVAALDPLRDERGRARHRRARRSSQVHVSLDPGESVVLRAFERRRISAPGFRTSTPEGERRDLRGRWSLEFLDGGPDLPRRRTLDALTSWTELGEPEAAFSGTARYSLTFTLEPGDANRAWALDLGTVRETARITVNGTEVGVAWAIPFRLPLGETLRAGENVLDIEVTNLAANRVRAMARAGTLPDDHFMSWRTTPPAEWDVQPSGLLGPVRLVELDG